MSDHLYTQDRDPWGVTRRVGLPPLIVAVVVVLLMAFGSNLFG